MFENYAESAKRTLFFAKGVAVQAGADEIAPEHIAIGLLFDEELATRLLPGLSPSELTEVSSLSLVGERSMPVPADLPLSLGSRDVLARAEDERRAVSHTNLLNEHITLALLKSGPSHIAELLRAKGLTEDAVRLFMLSQTETRPMTQDESKDRSRAPGLPADPILREFLATTIDKVKQLSTQGEQRQALKLLDEAMAESVPDRNSRINHLAPLATATARAIRDFSLVQHYCELRLLNDPNDAMALYGMAECLKQQGNLEEAKSYILRCYKLMEDKDRVREDVIHLLQTRFPKDTFGL